MASIGLQEIEAERIRLSKEMQLLDKQYEFYNQFHFNENLGQAISSIIREIDYIPCVCQKIVCEIPEHSEIVKRKLPGREKRETFVKHFNKKVYTYIAILESDDAYDKYVFPTKKDMNAFLTHHSLAYVDYFGILNTKEFAFKFPYLKLFFHLLNEWRHETGRVTLDDESVDKALNMTLQNDVVQNYFNVQMKTR